MLFEATASLSFYRYFYPQKAYFGNTGISEFYEHDFIALGPQVEMVESKAQHDKGMYFYLSYRTSGNIYNIGLQGQFRSNDYEVDAGEIKRITHTYGIGVVARPFQKMASLLALPGGRLNLIPAFMREPMVTGR